MAGFAIRRPDTAFAFDPSSKKTRRIEDARHLAFIRLLPCSICGQYPVEAAHIRAGSALHRKKHTGGAQKPDDAWSTPLCPDHHRAQHSTDELAWWRSHEIDPFELAVRLYEVSGDVQAAEAIIRKARHV